MSIKLFAALAAACLVGVCAGVVGTAADPTAGPAVRDALSSRTTGWVWVGLLAAILATAAALLATVRTAPIASKAAPPFTSSPRRAPAERPEAMAAGTEITSAQGQATSSSASPR